MCDHKNFKAQCDVTRLTNPEGDTITGYTTDISIMCSDCFKPFQFIGVPMGSSPIQPMCNFDGTELRAPIKPVI